MFEKGNLVIVDSEQFLIAGKLSYDSGSFALSFIPSNSLLLSMGECKFLFNSFVIELSDSSLTKLKRVY